MAQVIVRDATNVTFARWFSSRVSQDMNFTNAAGVATVTARFWENDVDAVDVSADANRGVFTVTQAGLYVINTAVNVDRDGGAQSNYGRLDIKVTLSGTEVTHTGRHVWTHDEGNVNAEGENVNTQETFFVYMNSGDSLTLDLSLDQVGNGTLDLMNEGSFLQIMRIN